MFIRKIFALREYLALSLGTSVSLVSLMLLPRSTRKWSKSYERTSNVGEMTLGTVFLQHVCNTPGAGFMNRRRLCQLTAAILTSDLTTHMWVL